MKNLLIAAAAVSLSFASVASAGEECHPTEAKAKDTAAAKATPASDKVIARGEKLKGAPGVTLKDLLANPEAHTGKTVLVEANVRKACTKKGCWMELADGEKTTGVRVTFKDYGFFVPLDSAGSKAKVEGEVKVAELTEENAKHLQAEGATVPRGKDGKPREVQLVASGVELRR